MEPRIQYAQTADGLSTAFWTLGKAMPVIHFPLASSHAQLECGLPECFRRYEVLAHKKQADPVRPERVWALATWRDLFLAKSAPLRYVDSRCAEFVSRTSGGRDTRADEKCKERVPCYIRE